MTSEQRAGVDRLPFAHVDLGDRAVAAGAQLVLHLHRFDDDDRLARGDRVARLRRARGRPCPASAPRAAAARTRRAPPSSLRPQRRRPFSVDGDRRRADVHRELPADRIGGDADFVLTHTRVYDAATASCASMRAASTSSDSRRARRPRRRHRRVAHAAVDRRPSNASSVDAMHVDLLPSTVDFDLVAARQRSPSARACALQRPRRDGSGRPPAASARRASTATAPPASAAAIAAISSAAGVGSTNGRPLRAFSTSSR